MLCDLAQAQDQVDQSVDSCDGQVGPSRAVIRHVVGESSSYLPAAKELLQAIFPEYSRYVSDLPVCALQYSPAHPATVDHLWIIEKAGKPIGLRLFHYIHTRNVGYGAFIGLVESERDQGISSWLVKQTLAQLCADARSFGRSSLPGYVIEVDPVSTAEDEVERIVRERRLAFHLRNHAYLLDVDYIEPPAIQGMDIFNAAELASVNPTPMQLAFYPVQPGTRLTVPELINVIEALYIDSYRLEPDSWYVRRAIASVMGDQARPQGEGRP
jgi:hypothetical protein